MARLIELRIDAQASPPVIAVQTGDLLTFAATGGGIHSGEEVVHYVGAFQSSVLGGDGQVIAPVGPPDTVLFLARCPGSAVLRIVTGNPWGTVHTMLLGLQVEAV